MNDVKISPHNSKLGQIPSISILPGKDCGNSDLCVKDCYAVKLMRFRSVVYDAWKHNSDLLHHDRSAYFAGIREYLRENNVRWFRWHVAGDLLDQDYLDQVKAIAHDFPECGFLCFTKMHHLRFGRLPKNLSIVASMWPGLEIPRNVRHLPKAWMQNGAEERVPKAAIECPGFCENCMMCWNLKNLERDVVFHKH